MTPADSPKSTGEMMADIMGNVGSLVRNEVDLARTEIAGSMTKAGAALGWMALAIALAITALNVLTVPLIGLVIWAGLPPAWATLAVGVGLLLLAWLIFQSAKSAINQIGFMPTRAAQNIQRDATAIKEAYNDK